MQEPLYFNGFSPTPLNLPATCSLNSDLKRKRASPQSVHRSCKTIRILIVLGNETLL